MRAKDRHKMVSYFFAVPKSAAFLSIISQSLAVTLKIKLTFAVRTQPMGKPS